MGGGSFQITCNKLVNYKIVSLLNKIVNYG